MREKRKQGVAGEGRVKRQGWEGNERKSAEALTFHHTHKHRAFALTGQAKKRMGLIRGKLGQKASK